MARATSFQSSTTAPQGASRRSKSRTKASGAFVVAVPKAFADKVKLPTGVRHGFVATTAAGRKAVEQLTQGVEVEVITKPLAAALPTAAEPDHSAYEPDARARALARGLKMRRDDLSKAGGTYELDDVRELMNGVTAQAVGKRVREGSLLAVPGPSNRRRYPTMQFTADGDVVAGLKAVSKAFPNQSPWMLLNFLVNPDIRLGGRTPIDLLKAGQVDPVVQAARTLGRQGG